MNHPEPAETKQNRSRSLLRLSKAARVKELNALPVEERLAMIHSAQGKDKYSLLLDAADGQQLLQILPPQDLFLLIKELGREDSRDLVAMASMDQVTVCIDLDSWQGDQLDDETSLDWLLAALGGRKKSSCRDCMILILIFLY
ncbi:hypothetical protein A7E78_12655 [Syntrophotalea acetylenivorans]|uniref:Uncharacterized protein n=1 Tax=Syntrophotalea acetylenivorans TaxID=1842532 RepID=A0A1L3GRR6_9BACT|nr:DUF6178 family protein [Syntrophotalea acetylenivorans]APG28619.1 hypothetical protein A7E78_12655 [Syntrophotalea acetylenivorans]